MIAELLKRRVSVRRFQNRPVPENVIQEMLEAARLSPSGGNEQPWMFGVITDCGLIEQIAKIVGISRDVLYFHANRHPADVKADVDQERVEAAYRAFRKALGVKLTGKRK